MADNSVFITGAATGAFTEALNGLPSWATEDTAEKIQKVLERSLNTQNKTLLAIVAGFKGMAAASAGSKGLTPDQIKKLNSELDDLVKNLKKENEFKKKTNKEEKADGEEKKKRRKEEYQIGAGLLAIQAGMLKLSSEIVSVYAKNIDTFDQLYAAGVNVVSGFDNVSSGFDALRDMTVLSGVRFTELAKTMTKYSSTINVFGAKNFAKTVGQVSASLTGLGYNSKETAELLGFYLESQKNMGNLTSISQDRVQKDLLLFGKRITALSQATGIAKSKLLEEVQALSKSIEAQVLATSVGSAGTQQTLEFIASFTDKKLGQEFLRMMTDQIKPLNATFQNFQKLGMGGFGQKMTTFANSLKGMTGPEAAKARTEWTRANRQQIDAMIRQANLYRQIPSLSGEAESILGTLTGLMQEEQSYASVKAEDREKMEKTSAASKDMANAFEAFKAQLMMTFSPMVSFLNAITWGVEKLNQFFDVLRSGVNYLEQKITGSQGVLINVIGATVVAFVALAGAMAFLRMNIFSTAKKLLSPGGGSFKDRLKSAWEDRGKSGTLGTKTNPMYVIVVGDKGLPERRGTRETSRPSRSPRPEPRRSRAPSDNKLGKILGELGEGLGKFLSGLGAGAGALIQSVLTGLAKGVEAFGNPAVLKGAAILSASIAILSVGIGAAAWVLGKTLPTLAEGINKFSVIDGKNLLDVGKGIAALAGGLMLFSGGSVLSSIGNVMSNVVDGIGKIFGSKSVIDKIREFASLGPNLKMAADGFTVIGSNISSLSKYLESFTGMDKLKEIVNTINSLNLLKAAAFAALGLAGIKQVTQPKAEPVKPAETTLKPKIALGTPRETKIDSPSAVSTNTPSPEQAQTKEVSKVVGSGIEKEQAAGSINSALSYQSSLIEQLVLSTKDVLSVNKEILKYTRAQ